MNFCNLLGGALGVVFAGLLALGQASAGPTWVTFPAGTVTSVSGGACLTGTVTTTGSLSGLNPVDARTTTSEAVTSSDQCKTVTYNNGSPVASTIAQAGTAGLIAGWKTSLLNLGAGTVTLTPTTSTINGAATLVLTSGQGCDLSSDGANYVAQCGAGSGGGGGSLTVTDGTTSVASTTTLHFTSGATVSNPGGGTANVAVFGSQSQFDGISGVRLKLTSGTPAVGNGAYAAMAWDVAEWDVGGWWTSGADVTVPAGVHYVDVQSTSYFPAASTPLTVTVFDGAVQQTCETGSPAITGAYEVALSCGALPVTPGDVLTFQTKGLTGETMAAPSFISVVAVGAPITAPFLEQHVASNSAELDFTTGINPACHKYELDVDGLVPSASGNDLWLQVGTGGPPTYQTSGYYWERTGNQMDSNTPTNAQGANDSKILLGLSLPTGTGESYSGRFTLDNLGSASLYTQLSGNTTNYVGALRYSWQQGGIWEGVSVTALRLIMSSGSIASAIATLNCVVQ